MGAHFYTLAGRTIVCDRSLPLLAGAALGRAGERGAITIRFGSGSGAVPHPPSWFHSWLRPGDSGETWLRFAEVEQGFLLDAPEQAQFAVSLTGDDIACFPSPAIAESTLHHLLLDHVLPLALGIMGDVVLHASGVALHGRSIALVGPSGRGKSTLAAHLGTRGAEILTDDCLVLRELDGKWYALPYYQGLRLWPESLQIVLPGTFERIKVSGGSDKECVLRHPAITFRREPARLGMIALLQEERPDVRAIALSALSHRDALMSVLPLMFFFEVRTRLALRNQFERLCRLVEVVPVCLFDFPRQFEALPNVGAAVVRAAPTNHRTGRALCADA